MSIAFSGGELVNMAVGIERRGIAFYDNMAGSTDNTAARDVFTHLADMEREHMRIFQGMLSEADKYQPPEAYAGEYAAYLQALIDSAVFTDDFVNRRMVTQSLGDIEALELAIGAEKESIIFYYEMKDLMPGRAQPAVDKIITEEKSHLRQLSELRKEIAATS